MKKIVIVALCLMLALGIAVTASAAVTVSLSGLPASIGVGETATVTVNLSGSPLVHSAYIEIELGEGLSLVSGKWIVEDSTLDNFNKTNKNGVISFSDPDVPDLPGVELNGSVLTFKIKGEKPMAKQTVKVTIRLKNESNDVGEDTITKTIDVACPGHQFGNVTKIDDECHGKTCSICGAEEKTAHGWDKGTETKPATCQQEGEKTYTCSACGATKTEVLPKVDHVFGNLIPDGADNHKDTCKTCNEAVSQPHTFDSGKVTKPATCKEEGEKTYTCKGCGYKKVETIAKTEDHKFGNLTAVDGENHKDTCSVCNKEITQAHTFDSGKVTKKATCKEEGEKTYTCKGCGYKKVETIAKTTDHKYGSWTKVDADTHKRACSVCGAEETAAHGYKTSWSKDKSGHWHQCSGCGDKKDFEAHTPGAAATETKAQTCKVCGYVIKAALGHTHKWDKNLTSDETGHWYECSGCEEKKDFVAHDFENGCDPDCATCAYTREVAHDMSDAWASDGTNHWHACTICGLKEEEGAHEAGAEATEFTAQKCTICDAELVAALGHSFSEAWNSDADNHWRDCECGEKGELAAHTYADGACSVCGAEEPSSFPIWIIIVAVVVVAGAVVAVIIIKKKK